MKFYDTDEFKKLYKKWQNNLKDAGFQEIEQEDGKLKVWSKLLVKARYEKATYEAKELYYRMASQFLHEHKFKTKLEFAVWEKHSSGVSYSKIDKLLGKTQGTSRRIIAVLVPIMKKTIRIESENDAE